jgi:hypothetical protein
MLKSISLIMFVVTVFLLTRQLPFHEYSKIMNISLVLLIFINIKSIYKNTCKFYIINKLLFVYILYIILLSYVSFVFYDNQLSLIFRFGIILLLIILAYFLNGEKNYISFFMFFIFLQAIFVIFLEIYLIANFDLKTYMPIRHYFLDNGLGDIYTFTGTFWNIQPRGNALLPFGLFVTVIYYKGFIKYFLSAVFLAAIICAGNFAYILGISFFSLMLYIHYIKWTNKNIVINGFLILLLLFTVAVPIYNNFSKVVEKKALTSNPMRIEQAGVLIDDVSENIITLLTGKGLGNTINLKTSMRDYTNNIYYELQIIYALNQMGLFYFLFFLFLNVILAIIYIKHKVLLITYSSYILYGLFNPYILDTNHIVVILILISLKKVFDEKNLLNTRSI